MTSETPGLAARARDKLLFEVGKRLHRDSISGAKIHPRPGLVRIGSEMGGWVVPADLLNERSVCYCAGVGEDISFDLALIERYGCEVHAFDPTPRAIAHVEKHAAGNPRFRFFPVGLWDQEETLRFFAPKNPSHVSHSVLNLQQTGDYFEAPCKPLAQLMKENGHDRIDLLKLDIEGAEYRVVRSILDRKLAVRVLCVEYDECFNPLDRDYKSRIAESVSGLLDYGFQLVHVDRKGNYTLVRRDA
jgi:FkbM family methyltransferase